jgi:transcriptional regulator with XRE-family HTH domain
MQLRIKELRDEKGWNQTTLGYHSDLSPSEISLIENGKRNPSATTLQRIATALGVEVGDLFPKVPSSSPQTPEAQASEERREAEWAFLKLATSNVTRGRELEKDLKSSAASVVDDVVWLYVDDFIVANYLHKKLTKYGAVSPDVKKAYKALTSLYSSVSRLTGQEWQLGEDEWREAQKFRSRHANTQHQRDTGTEDSKEATR